MADTPPTTTGTADAVERFLSALPDPAAVEVRRYPVGTRTAADAARAIRCEVGQIVKSLVFDGDGEAILVLTSGANRVDTAKVAAALDLARVAKADAAMVKRATGFSIGGTPPFGHPGVLPTLVDRDLLDHDELWAAAGAPDSVFRLDPDELVARSNGTVTDVADRRD